MNRYKRNAVGAFILTLSLIGVASLIFVSKNPAQSDISKRNAAKVSSPLPSSSPFPFYDMTIPYLQSRSYTGRLGEMEIFSENSEFTTYLTSYDSDGLNIYGLLTVPFGEPPSSGWPAVVFVHGYIPPSLYRTTERYQDYVNFLARNGLVVFKIDLRGHGNSDGKAFGAYYSSDYIVDVLNARSALQNVDFINPDEVGLWGHSMAGNVILRSIAADHNIGKAVIWAGAGFTYSDLQKYGIDDDSYRPPRQDSEREERRAKLRQTHGEFDPDSPFWQSVVPTNYLDGYEGELHLHHAVNDTTVNIGYSRNLADLLRQKGVAYELFEYDSGGHDIEGAAFNQAMQRTADFLK